MSHFDDRLAELRRVSENKTSVKSAPKPGPPEPLSAVVKRMRDRMGEEARAERARRQRQRDRLHEKWCAP